MTENEITIGWTQRNLQRLCDGYGRIGEIYKRISFCDIADIRRCHPILWKTYTDCEKDFDILGHKMAENQFKCQIEKMATIWENIALKVSRDVAYNVKRGMPPPISNATHDGLRIYKDGSTDMVQVGYCTLQEIKDWLDFKITIQDLQEKNTREFRPELGRRFNNSFMIFCELGEAEKKPEPIKEDPKAIITKQRHLPIVNKKEEAKPELEVISDSMPASELGLELDTEDGDELTLDIEVKESWN
jgi:hypothetical protein